MPIYYSLNPCTLGQVLIAQSERGICAILLGDNAEYLHADLQQRFATDVLHETHHKPHQADKILVIDSKQIINAIERPTNNVNFPLDIRGTDFQKKVWAALQEIPTGETRSYTQVAQMIDSPKAVRAVAGACAANAIAVLIPCHRVLRNDGNLSGYRWGIERKQQLLQCESNYKPLK